MLAISAEDIRVRKENREFRTVTGTFESNEVTIISSGIGTDNIDILINELDALVNIDLETGDSKRGSCFTYFYQTRNIRRTEKLMFLQDHVF